MTDRTQEREIGSHYFALPRGFKLFEFEIESLLGHGGFGLTYRAVDTWLQEIVAIKEYLPNEIAVRLTNSSVRAKSDEEQPNFERGLKAFLEEARIMALFRHPRIVQVRRFFELHGTAYIVLEYEHGKTLATRLEEGPIFETELRELLLGILDALDVIHDHALLHRDLKPNNIMLRESGEPVLIDFGAARDFAIRHSRSVTAIAAPGYSPPEQYGVGGQYGPWSDLYSLGAIAYRCVTGAAPVDSLRRLRNDPLIPAAVAAAGKFDAVLLRTIDWMLRVDEDKRPLSASRVRESLATGIIPEADEATLAAHDQAISLEPKARGTRITKPIVYFLGAILVVVFSGFGLAAVKHESISAASCERFGMFCTAQQTAVHEALSCLSETEACKAAACARTFQAKSASGNLLPRLAAVANEARMACATEDKNEFDRAVECATQNERSVCDIESCFHEYHTRFPTGYFAENVNGRARRAASLCSASQEQKALNHAVQCSILHPCEASDCFTQYRAAFSNGSLHSFMEMAVQEGRNRCVP